MALDGFSHAAAVRTFPWDLANALEVIREHSDAISDPSGRDIISHFVSSYEDIVVPKLGVLRRSVIHNDVNDFNIMVGDEIVAEEGQSSHPQVTGLIDFGDMVHSCTIYDLAVCLAYAMLDKPDPIRAAADVVSGYHEVFPLTETELEVLFSLSCIRMCTSVSMAAYQRQRAPYNAYLSISEKPAWALLKQLQRIQPYETFCNLRCA
jgi:Ser/Thr protein kinase RdoA (MazF antagonist)